MMIKNKYYIKTKFIYTTLVLLCFCVTKAQVVRHALHKPAFYLPQGWEIELQDVRFLVSVKDKADNTHVKNFNVLNLSADPNYTHVLKTKPESKNGNEDHKQPAQYGQLPSEDNTEAMALQMSETNGATTRDMRWEYQGIIGAVPDSAKQKYQYIIKKISYDASHNRAIIPADKNTDIYWKDLTESNREFWQERLGRSFDQRFYAVRVRLKRKPGAQDLYLPSTVATAIIPKEYLVGESEDQKIFLKAHFMEGYHHYVDMSPPNNNYDETLTNGVKNGYGKINIADVKYAATTEENEKEFIFWIVAEKELKLKQLSLKEGIGTKGMGIHLTDFVIPTAEPHLYTQDPKKPHTTKAIDKDARPYTPENTALIVDENIDKKDPQLDITAMKKLNNKLSLFLLPAIPDRYAGKKTSDYGYDYNAILEGINDDIKNDVKDVREKQTDLYKDLNKTKRRQNSGEYEHDMFYMQLRHPYDDSYWLSNNLGAFYTNLMHPNFNPLQQAKHIFDPMAFGSIFEQFRHADGHELRDMSIMHVEENGWYRMSRGNPRSFVHYKLKRTELENKEAFDAFKQKIEKLKIDKTPGNNRSKPSRREIYKLCPVGDYFTPSGDDIIGSMGVNKSGQYTLKNGRANVNRQNPETYNKYSSLKLTLGGSIVPIEQYMPETKISSYIIKDNDIGTKRGNAGGRIFLMLYNLNANINTEKAPRQNFGILLKQRLHKRVEIRGTGDIIRRAYGNSFYGGAIRCKRFDDNKFTQMQK